MGLTVLLCHMLPCEGIMPFAVIVLLLLHLYVSLFYYRKHHYRPQASPQVLSTISRELLVPGTSKLSLLSIIQVLSFPDSLGGYQAVSQQVGTLYFISISCLSHFETQLIFLVCLLLLSKTLGGDIRLNFLPQWLVVRHFHQTSSVGQKPHQEYPTTKSTTSQGIIQLTR